MKKERKSTIFERPSIIILRINTKYANEDHVTWLRLHASVFNGGHVNLTGDRRQTKQFCFLDADCLVVGESQSSSRRSAGRYPVKPPRPEGDCQSLGIESLCFQPGFQVSILEILTMF